MTPQRYIRTLYIAWKLAVRNHYKAACALSGNAGRHCAKIAPRIIGECAEAMACLDSPMARMQWVRIMDNA